MDRNLTLKQKLNSLKCLYKLTDNKYLIRKIRLKSRLKTKKSSQMTRFWIFNTQKLMISKVTSSPHNPLILKLTSRTLKQTPRLIIPISLTRSNKQNTKYRIRTYRRQWKRLLRAYRPPMLPWAPDRREYKQKRIRKLRRIPRSWQNRWSRKYWTVKLKRSRKRVPWNLKRKSKYEIKRRKRTRKLLWKPAQWKPRQSRKYWKVKLKRSMKLVPWNLKQKPRYEILRHKQIKKLLWTHAQWKLRQSRKCWKVKLKRSMKLVLWNLRRKPKYEITRHKHIRKLLWTPAQWKPRQSRKFWKVKLKRSMKRVPWTLRRKPTNEIKRRKHLSKLALWKHRQLSWFRSKKFRLDLKSTLWQCKPNTQLQSKNPRQPKNLWKQTEWRQKINLQLRRWVFRLFSQIVRNTKQNRTLMS